MSECSVCSKGEEAARIVNELLERKTPLREIQAQTSIHKNSLHRHQHGNCRFSFSKFKAAKIKSKAPNLDGRMIVSWPERDGDGQPAHFSYFDRILHEQDLLPADTLFIVEYATRFDPATHAEQNRTHVSNAIVAEAREEDASRSKLPT